MCGIASCSSDLHGIFAVVEYSGTNHFQPIYLDCAATSPMDARIHREVMRYMAVDFGNAHSRNHKHGERAHQAVERARGQVAAVVGASRGEVVFTSGATESNNLAILGLSDHGI